MELYSSGVLGGGGRLIQILHFSQSQSKKALEKEMKEENDMAIFLSLA